MNHLKYASLLLVLLAISGCDRFADEERRLVIDVVDADGRLVSGARVHAAVRLSDGVTVPTSFRYFATTGQFNQDVSYIVVREANGVRTDTRTAGKASLESPAVIEVGARDVGGGLFRLRVAVGQQTSESLFALAVDRSVAAQAPPTLVTGSNGTAELDLDAFGIGRTLDVTLSANVEEAQVTRRVTVLDTLDLVVFLPDAEPWTTAVGVGPGLTRATLTEPN